VAVVERMTAQILAVKGAPNVRAAGGSSHCVAPATSALASRCVDDLMDVAHNHDLTRVTNFGIGFGGVLRLIKVEPSKAVQGTRVCDFAVSVCES
jgi:hypothetical protein